MTSDYQTICDQIDFHVQELAIAKTKRCDHLVNAKVCLARIVENANAADVFELQLSLDGIRHSVAHVRDGVRQLISDQTLLQAWFSVRPAIEEKKTGFFSKVFDRSKKEPEVILSSPQINAQEAFEKVKYSNEQIVSSVESAVDFLDVQDDEFIDLLVDAKEKVISLNRSMDKTPEWDIEVISRLKGQSLEIEDAISNVGKYLKEVTLLRREFQPIYDEIEYAAFTAENDIINIRNPDDIKRVTGKSQEDYALSDQES